VRAALPPDSPRPDARAMTRPAFALGEAQLAAHTLALSAAQRETIAHYVALLRHWNRRINLVGTQDAETLWQRHVLDCLMLATVPRPPAPRHWIDVGAGAGLPGVLLAILYPADRITAVESVARKATFLREAARQLALANFACAHADVRRLHEEPGFAPVDALVARAFAPLAELLALGPALLLPGGEVWAMKGRRWPAEAAQVPPALLAAYEPAPGVYPYRLGPDADGVVLVYRLHGHRSTGA
jgi:16S rRNA (guanine527-N7)-methyltransferase